MSGNLSVEEMVIDDSFYNYCFNKNESDILLWKQYLVSFPGQKEKVDEARQIVLGLTAMLGQMSQAQEAASQPDSGKLVSMRSSSGFGKKVLQYAAACIILVLAASVYFYFSQAPQDHTKLVTIQAPQDIKAPDASKAQITLANGDIIYLDSAGNGSLAQQGSVKLLKLANGEIAYESEFEGDVSAIQYNTLTNPRGSRVINLTLSDGTKVWLNAGSSITFPIVFTGNERNVSITGEGYFEVAHDAKKPFKVSKATMEVVVLGTHFNVNAYDDESAIKVTLLEGAVKVNKLNHSAVLKPGQQASISNEIQVNSSVNINAVMAWKNGYFSFEETDLATLMRQIGRWYDVEIVYAGKIPERRFGGEISRNMNASQVLKILEESNVKFKVEQKKIIVLP